MHRKIRLTEIGIFVLTLCLGFPRLGRAGEPLEVVRGAVDKAVQILKDSKLQSQDKRKERVDRLREVLNPIFDYEEMAKRALGTHWRRRTPAEQEELVKLFRDFLERTYSDKVDLYGGEKVRFGREVIAGTAAQVEAAIVKPKGWEIDVSSELRHVSSQWQGYDALVVTISIVNNSRSHVVRIISDSSYAERVERLQEQVRGDA